MREWWSAPDLASLSLPGLPTTRQGVSKRADAEGWSSRDQESSAVGRPAREYHISHLPAEARAALLLREREAAPPASQKTAPAADPVRSEALWEQFERKPASVREEAERRLDAVRAVEQLAADGCKRTDAYAAVASELGVSTSTVRNWVRLVKDAHAGDWLPLLAPQYTGRTTYAEYDERIYQWFRDLYLSSSRPPYAICYERVEKIAAEEGLEVPSIDTLKRELERREDPVVVTMEREGERRAMELFPHLSRSRAGFHAIEALNMDGHTLDLATVWPDGEVCRTTLIAIQDLYSNAYVGWRLAKAESAQEIGLAVLQVCDEWGIPEHLYVDNTLAMASKRMTAGAKNRYRFKNRDGDPLGVLPQLGVEVHFTTPAHGQAKPIERSFREIADRVSKHPAFEGAYLGNNPLNKPHDYGSRAIPVEELIPVCDQEILAYNQRQGRRTEVCAGRMSFWQAFSASYEKNAERIRRITETQRRLLYLVSDAVTVRSREAEIHLLGNRYHSEQLLRYRGRKVVVRYHPQKLHESIYVYTLAGDFLCDATCVHAVGFADAEAAERYHRAKRQWKRRKKDLTKATRRMEAAEVAAKVPPPKRAEVPPAATGTDGKVVRGTFGVSNTLEKVATVLPGPSKREAAERRAFQSLDKIAGALDADIKRKGRRTG